MKNIKLPGRTALIVTFIHHLRDSVFALQVFNVIRFTAFFLVSIILVKLPMSFDQIATYEYVLFLSSIVTGWWIHGFIQAFMADGGESENGDPGKMFRVYSRIFILMGGSILVTVIAGIEILSVWNILKEPPPGFYYFLFFHFILQAGILMIYYFHQRGWPVYIYIYASWFLITYVGSFIILGLEASPLPVVYRWLAGLSLPVIVVWLYLYLIKGPDTTPTTSVRFIPHLSLLVLIQGIGFVSLWSDGFWVQYFYGTEEIFALFRYGAREFPLFIILTTTFSTAMIRHAGDEKGLTRIRKGSARFILWFAPMIMALLLTSQWLFEWIYSKDFVPASFIFDTYLLLILVRVIFPRPVLISTRRFYDLMWISVGELFINVILSFGFYWIWGIVGLLLASLVAHFFEMGASVYLVRTRLGIEMRRYIPVRLYFLFAFGVVMVFIVKYGWFTHGWMTLFDR